MLSPEITEILNTIDIESYLDREGVTYRETHGSSGKQLNVQTCPTCGGDKWKVFLNQETGLGNCFSGQCEQKFNKFSFIRHQSGLSGHGLDEHIKQVGREIGWRPTRKAAIVETTSKSLVLPESFALPTDDGRNLAYLTNRGITKEATKYFYLRYCHDAYWDAGDHLKNFGKRVIIPIFDIEGEMVSFQARDTTGIAEKKYLFPNGYASTGEHLYNAHNVRDTTRVVLGEGVFDVIAIKIAFDEESDLRSVVPIGSFGKHLAINQIDKFRQLQARGVNEVTIMWDGELLALDAAVKVGLALRGIGLNVRIATLPQGADPNEISAAEVRRCFYGAISLTRMSAVTLRMNMRAEYAHP